MATFRFRSLTPGSARLFDVLSLGAVLAAHGGLVLAMSRTGNAEGRITPPQVLQVAWLGNDTPVQAPASVKPDSVPVRHPPVAHHPANAAAARPARLLSASRGQVSNPAPEPGKAQDETPRPEATVQAEQTPAAIHAEGATASRTAAHSEKEATSTPASFSADYLSNPAPVYPRLSRSLREQGKVLLRIRVSAQGQAEAVDLQRSSGYTRLDEAALQAVRAWRFVPARRGDEAVPAWVVVPIEFTLRG